MNKSKQIDTPQKFAMHVADIMVVDPDTGGEVEVSLYKDRTSGGIFGVDGSYLMEICEDGLVTEPFNGQEVILLDGSCGIRDERIALAKECGFDVRPDSDQPGYYYFVDPHGNYSDISFESEQAAWLQILSEWDSYQDVEAFNSQNGPDEVDVRISSRR